MAKERDNKQIKTHVSLVEIYDKFRDEFEKKFDVRLSYPQITKRIAKKLISVGGLRVEP